jgi:predicted lipoprotein
MPRVYVVIAAAAFIGVLCWFVPLVRVVPLTDVSAVAAQFDAHDAAEHLWTSQLPATFAKASDAATALQALLKDPHSAKQKFGITRGVGRGFLLYLHGKGQVLNKDKKGIAIGLPGNSEASLLLHTGMVFGSAVRDATGMIDASEARSSEQSNALAQELNLLVENRVIDELVEVTSVGDNLEFVGCVEVKDPERVSLPLVVIPVSISLE